jgi:hypothetical protein
MKKIKLLFASFILIGSISFVYANGDASLEDGGSTTPDCTQYCTASQEYHCQIRRSDSTTICYFKKVKAEYGGIH